MLKMASGHPAYFEADHARLTPFQTRLRESPLAVGRNMGEGPWPSQRPDCGAAMIV